MQSAFLPSFFCHFSLSAPSSSAFSSPQFSFSSAPAGPSLTLAPTPHFPSKSLSSSCDDDCPSHIIHAYVQALVREQRQALGINLTIRDRSHGHYPPQQGPYIFALLNQTSLVESLICPEIPVPFSTFANVEYLLLPFAGWLCAAAGAIPVVRQWRWHRRRAVARANAFLAQHPSHAMYMSVEGQRSPNGRLGPYHLGCARMALANSATIVPLVIRGARECLPYGSWRLRGGCCELEFLTPISTRKLSNTKDMAIALTAQLRELAKQELQ